MNVLLCVSSCCNSARGLYSVLMCCHRDAAAVSLQCGPKEQEGEYPNPFGPATKNVPRFISSRGLGGGREGVVERPLFRSFVYVRSGRRVLGEQRSLGMLGLYSLGIICSSLVCTVYSRCKQTVGYVIKTI